MLWVSQRSWQKELDDKTRRLDAILTRLDAMDQCIAALPADIVQALRELPAKVLAPVVDQPPSIAVADKRRVQEARDREKETR